VRVFEDQILRGKDMGARAELARKVAQMWEIELADPREAADAWRRVLRMKQGDPEATAGLERAKSNMLKTLDAPSERKPSVAPSPQPTPPEAASPASPEDAGASSSTTPVPTEEIVARDTLASNVFVPAGAVPAVEVRAPSSTPVADATATALHDDPDAPEERDLTHLDLGPVHHEAGPEPRREASVITPVPTEHDVPDFTDTTYPHTAAASPPTESELMIDVDASGESEAIDVDVLLPEDLTEGDTDGEESPPAAATAPDESQAKPAPKRSTPPPLPRSGSN
jgi:hypothetical protein